MQEQHAHAVCPAPCMPTHMHIHADTHMYIQDIDYRHSGSFEQAVTFIQGQDKQKYLRATLEKDEAASQKQEKVSLSHTLRQQAIGK